GEAHFFQCGFRFLHGVPTVTGVLKNVEGKYAVTTCKRGNGDVVNQGEVGVDLRALKYPGNTQMIDFVGLVSQDRAAVERNGAFVRHEAADELIQKGAFACAVRSDNAVYGAFADAEINVIRCHQTAEALDEPLYL